MATTRRVCRSRVLPAPRGRVWAALIEGGADWLGVGGSVDLRTPGGIGMLTEPDGTARRVVVEDVDAGERIVLRWCGDRGPAAEPSRVEVQLHDAGAGATLVTVTEIVLADVALTESAR